MRAHFSLMELSIVAATLPVKQLQQRTAAVEKHIHGAVDRLPARQARDSTQRLNALAEVHALAVDHKTVGFIQTKHSKTYFCGCKGTNKHAHAKYVLNGMVTLNYRLGGT